ncbi:MAG: PilZ domain-containing protein [Sphingomicrobium sp.]
MTQNRSTRRSHVLMAATLELSGGAVPVKLRNLSAEGALVEGDHLPVEGSELLFRKGDLCVPGRVAWSHHEQAGIAFSKQLPPDLLLRHIPVPRPRVKLKFNRPGFASRALTAEEKRFAEVWVGKLLNSPGD